MQSEEKKDRKEVCANERFFTGFNVLLDRNALDRRLVKEYERRIEMQECDGRSEGEPTRG